MFSLQALEGDAQFISSIKEESQAVPDWMVVSREASSGDWLHQQVLCSLVSLSDAFSIRKNLLSVRLRILHTVVLSF